MICLVLINLIKTKHIKKHTSSSQAHVHADVGEAYYTNHINYVRIKYLVFGAPPLASYPCDCVGVCEM